MSEYRGPRLFLVEHNGVYLGAISLIWATSAAVAREDALRLIRENKLREEIYTITELTIGEDRLVWNGDY
jgi:hypothetical protein